MPGPSNPFDDQREFDINRLPIAGRATVDGSVVVWRANPWGDGFWMQAGELTMHMVQQPNEERIQVALWAYKQGLEHGEGQGAERTRRAILKALGTT